MLSVRSASSSSMVPLDRFRPALRRGGWAATILGALAVAILGGAVQAAELEPVAEVEGIREYRLENGLKVLLFPDPSIPTVTVNITYRVGSRHEGAGEAGMAHLLEHMVFKGTPTHPDVWDALEDRGADFNGTTWVDRTNYYETLPASSENLSFALELEADRMIHSTIRAEDLATEMTVVRNEFEAGENDPLGVLRERMLSTAYLWHSYGRPTIGNRSDIERVPVESLRRFYRTHYQPDNAMLVVSGRFDEAFALAEIQRTFGKIPRPERVLDAPYTVEPPQDGARSVVLRRVGSIASAALLYHVPSGSHPDVAALEILGEVLAGDPNGRLYQTLVKGKSASRVYHSVYSWHDPGVLLVQAEIPKAQDAEKVQAALIEALEGVAGTLKDDEIERARNTLLKEYRLALADSRRIAIALSDAEALGDWRLLFLARDALAAVTQADVERVAQSYLLGSNRTAGLFLPTEQPKRAAIPPTPDVKALVAGYKGSEKLALGEAFDTSAANIERSTQRAQVGGMKLALLPKATRGGLVNAQLRFEYGTEEALGPHATALQIMPALLERGTQKRSYAELSAELDRLQTELRFGGEAGVVDVTVRTTREQLPGALRLIAEMLRTPSFPQDQLDVLRNEELANIERSRSDPQGMVFDALYRAFEPYPKDSIHYRPTFDERAERLRKLDRKQIAKLHRTHLGAGHAHAAFVGDFDPAELQKLLQELFADWRSAAPYARIVQPQVPIATLDQTFDTPDKEMTVVARGTAFAMRDTNPDYSALRFANYVLGQSPSSRLLGELRQKRGLSYGAGSFVRASSEDERAQLAAYAICAPQNAREAQSVIQAEFQRWLSEPIPDAELAAARVGYVESLKNDLASDAWVARQLLESSRLDRPFTFVQELVDSATPLTGAQIQQALQRQLGAAPFVDLKAGDASKFTSAEPAAESAD